MEGNNPVNRTTNPMDEASARRAIKPHSTFFFNNDSLVAIQVGDTMFNVHKYQLAKSEVFSDMFNMPKPSNQPEQGSSPDHPIIINDMTASDFAALLTFLYAGNQSTPDASLIIPAFRTANKFKFSELRAYLLPLAENNLNDVDKIVFAREFTITPWLVPAYTRLCQREHHLTTEEARKLQADSVLMISRIREQAHHRVRARKSPAVVGSVYCQNCAGWQYFAFGDHYCQHCHTHARTHYLRYNGSGAMQTDSTAVAGSVYCHDCSGWQYFACGHHYCQHCHTNANTHYVRYNGPGPMGKSADTNAPTLESEVKQWVQDNYPA